MPPSTQYITGAVYAGDLIDVRISAAVPTASHIMPNGGGTLPAEQAFEPVISA